MASYRIERGILKPFLSWISDILTYKPGRKSGESFRAFQREFYRASAYLFEYPDMFHAVNLLGKGIRLANLENDPSVFPFFPTGRHHSSTLLKDEDLPQAPTVSGKAVKDPQPLQKLDEQMDLEKVHPEAWPYLREAERLAELTAKSKTFYEKSCGEAFFLRIATEIRIIITLLRNLTKLHEAIKPILGYLGELNCHPEIQKLFLSYEKGQTTDQDNLDAVVGVTQVNLIVANFLRKMAEYQTEFHQIHVIDWPVIEFEEFVIHPIFYQHKLWCKRKDSPDMIKPIEPWKLMDSLALKCGELKKLESVFKKSEIKHLREKYRYHEKRFFRTVKARSLALCFMSAHPDCVRAIPCEDEDGKSEESSLTMFVYVDAGDRRIPTDLEKAAKEVFADYKVELVNLQRLPLSELVTHLSPNEKTKGEELSDLTKIIEKNLHVFENRLNVTGVRAGYKVVDCTEKNTPCVTVFVLGKRKIPLGETDFKKIEALIGYPVDVMEGYCKPCVSTFPLEGGIGIGVKGDSNGVGTLGGFLEDQDGNRYLLSCEHVIHRPEGSVIVQPAECSYDKDCKKADNQLKILNERLKLQRERYECTGDEKYEEQAQKTESEIELFKKLKTETPRKIGTYSFSVKRNKKVTVDGKTRMVYVDAAVAEMEEDEVENIELEKQAEGENNRCPLYGFKNPSMNEQWESNITALTGKFIGLTQSPDDNIEFFKTGYRTGPTDSGLLDTSAFVKLYGKQSDICAGSMMSFPYKLYCPKCRPATGSELIDISKYRSADRLCAKCNKKIKCKPKETARALWAYNCLTFSKKYSKPFCEEGDSGAMVFDSKGRAWGMIFGTMKVHSLDRTFALASPLRVTLKALGKVSGKNFKLWTTTDVSDMESDDESYHDMKQDYNMESDDDDESNDDDDESDHDVEQDNVESGNDMETPKRCVLI